MKSTLFAGLLVLSLMIGCSTATTSSSAPASSAETEAEVALVPETEAVPTYDVALSVPKMNCPFACWPKVKETLEHQPGVAAVELAQQQKENAIDNPVVYLTLNGEFSADKSIAALGDAGFDGATVSE
ncbi:MAG: hypothetical protein KDB05_22225 [Planctomycetales bacterium]|nr:hypothetical protein [Planctomycetales bacterium]